MKISERISAFLLSKSFTPLGNEHYRSVVLKTATGMAEWAADFTYFNDACNRAEILGDFLLHYANRDETKAALCNYLEKICQMESLPRWVRRDIIFCLSHHFLEPDIDNVYDDMLNYYGYSESDCEKVEHYYAATTEARLDLREQLDEEVLKLLAHYDQEKQYYLENAQYISELDALVDAIECDKYRI